MKTVLISGGSGMIGRYLSEKLIQKNYLVRWLSRKKVKSNNEKIKVFQWSIEKGEIDLSVFENVEYVINLSGAGIVDKRWTEAYKREILNSRVKSAHLLVGSILKENVPIRKFVGASAIGFYGMKKDEMVYEENSSSGDDFLSEVCLRWEEAYHPLIDKKINWALLRIGLVLSHTGGIYAKLKPLFQLGLGCALGNGRQYMSWIHIDDLCGMIIYLLENENICGVYNAVSTDYVTNAEFSRRLAQSFNSPFFLPNVPEYLLKLILGERYKMFTSGVKVSNEKIRKTGFQFQFSKLEDALTDLKIKSGHGK